MTNYIKGIDEIKYSKLCKKYSTLILERIICPYCGYVYSSRDSIEYGVGSDCEDEVVINCLKCNKKIKVNSNCTGIRFWAEKADEV